MKRKKGGKRCVGKADAMARICRWKAEASGEVADRLQALGEAVAWRRVEENTARLVREWCAAPQQLRQDW